MRSGTASDAPSRRREIANESAQHIAVAALVTAKAAFVVPMTVIFFVSYIGLTALAGFAKGFLALKVIGAVNLGFMLIAGNYVLAWLLAIIYVHVANTTFDPMVERASPLPNRLEIQP
jgi:uncharacterized membrane protein (DUF485 family)